MSVELNHTIVYASDRNHSAQFLADLLGLPDPTDYGPFRIVQIGSLSLDFMDSTGPVMPQHYAFLVDVDDFDAIFARIRERGIEYWADPFHNRPGQINHNDGGRGVYWSDPDGHSLEIITRPYGG
ncbi:VOC family protein [Aldersonia sp. NBC_00410]|jgi:catechol 2,3-dioxygenase-like lactoylglutathione lyase family enzyme|uniref:VOC family protein n=1 Tax=Aldersonia sp. NBC_00410 TaxID=2975954 RepID=UPI002258DC60|nr:VOC family protein [Aldersonia sp. NBC_00410]MCX5042076.1 VOC family protein [Aldersonia sp. NBC_00410]